MSDAMPQHDAWCDRNCDCDAGAARERALEARVAMLEGLLREAEPHVVQAFRSRQEGIQSERLTTRISGMLLR